TGPFELQVSPPSLLRNTPALAVPAYTMFASLGLIDSESTGRVPIPVPAEVQREPPSLLRKRPFAVAAYSLCGRRGSIAMAYTVRGVAPLPIPLLLNAQFTPPSVLE